MAKRLQNIKLSIIVGALQIIFLILFAVFVEYDANASPKATTNPPVGDQEIQKYYAMFQDVHVMMFIGFGFLMTFMKRYGFSSVGLNLLVASLVIQWATLMHGFFHMIPAEDADSHNNTHDEDHSKDTIRINMETLLTSDFCAAAILISMGALLGKISPLQLMIMAFLEVMFFQANEWIGLQRLRVADVGGSMFVHVFGAYFGIAAGRVLYNKKNQDQAESKEGSVYHSDMFAMIGTIFLWLFWPSFNSAIALDGDDRYRAIMHTYFSLAACTVTSFAISSVVEKGKFDMVHVQNATLAGGVAVGAVADLNIHPWGAILIGMASAALSVLGYRYISPFLTKKLGLHDTCGVNNLHGMPGIMAGIAGIIVAALAKQEDYGDSLTMIYGARDGKDGRSAGLQAGYQAAALALTLAISIVGGIITGFILRLSFFEPPAAHQYFDDSDYWAVPQEGFPSSTMVIPGVEDNESGASVPMAASNGKDNEVTKI